ncbi:MAG: translocation/assembly module TamB, partial [Haemophilus parahaemolyticus]|nr:translocation/assembly module TamB [Haemophilus parahaemolyticus]
MQEQEMTEKSSETESKQSVTKPKTKGKFLRWVLCGIPLLLFGGIGYLTTGYGQRSVIHLADRLLDELSIEQVEGSLQEGLTLTNAQYKMAGIDVSTGLAQLHFDFSCLWQYDACLENLSLKDMQVAIDTSKLPPSKPQEESEPFTELNLPLGITAKKIALDNISVKVDELDIQLDHFQSGIQGKGRSVILFPTELSGLAISLAPMEAENLEAKQTLQSEEQSAKEPIDWATIQQTLNSPFLTKKQPLVLPLDFNIEQLNLANINITQKPLTPDEKPSQVFNLDQATLKAKADHQTVEISRLNLKSQQGNLSAQGLLMLNGDYPIDLQLHAEGLQNFSSAIPMDNADVALSGDLFQKTALNVKTIGAIQAELTGDIALTT